MAVGKAFEGSWMLWVHMDACGCIRMRDGCVQSNANAYGCICWHASSSARSGPEYARSGKTTLLDVSERINSIRISTQTGEWSSRASFRFEAALAIVRAMVRGLARGGSSLLQKSNYDCT